SRQQMEALEDETDPSAVRVQPPCRELVAVDLVDCVRVPLAKRRYSEAAVFLSTADGTALSGCEGVLPVLGEGQGLRDAAGMVTTLDLLLGGDAQSDRPTDHSADADRYQRVSVRQRRSSG
ncbi:hypothetical protein ACWCRD_44655, partial [Streptomyces sp. NPDC002092]